MVELAKPQVGDTWYRCEDRRYASLDDYGDIGHVRHQLETHTFTVSKVTPKGVWLKRDWFAPRFVLLTANKRFACPTKVEALESLKARKARQISILAARQREAEHAVMLANSELQRLNPKPAPAKQECGFPELVV